MANFVFFLVSILAAIMIVCADDTTISETTSTITVEPITVSTSEQSTSRRSSPSSHSPSPAGVEPSTVAPTTNLPPQVVQQVENTTTAKPPTTQGQFSGQPTTNSASTTTVSGRPGSLNQVASNKINGV